MLASDLLRGWLECRSFPWKGISTVRMSSEDRSNDRYLRFAELSSRFPPSESCLSLDSSTQNESPVPYGKKIDCLTRLCLQLPVALQFLGNFISRRQPPTTGGVVQAIFERSQPSGDFVRTALIFSFRPERRSDALNGSGANALQNILPIFKVKAVHVHSQTAGERL